MTTREQRTLRLGAVGGIVILAYVLLLDPYVQGRAESRARLEEREAQLARLIALDQSLPAYRQRQAAAVATWEREIVPRLLPSDIPAVAASALSEEVRRIAAQSFLEVERENVLPSTDEAGLTSVPVQFSLRGDIYGLRDFLAAIESSDSFLNLREIRVTAIAGGFNQQAVQRGAPLQITVTVEGYLGGAPSAVEAPPTALGGETGTETGVGGALEGAAGGGAAGVPGPAGAGAGAGAAGTGASPTLTPGLRAPPSGVAPAGVGVPPGGVAGPAPELTAPQPAPRGPAGGGAPAEGIP